ATVLRQVGLEDRRRVRIRRLSGGQRKRVAVALELLTSPPLVILDEPTSGLDPGLEAKMMVLLADVAATGRIVLVATHAMASLDRADALCVLVRGHVAFFGPPREALSFFRVERYEGLFHQLE
ncbi:MAG: ATP-binding cassette domain-containing protein, partial [Gammaproteobacteria bacterium]|nr:ATP-binding cassette domain-containing protein [Gammaproteobacteria bacterium]